MRKYPNTDFSSEILRSVISTNAFDAQSEGTREMYYYDLISIAVNKEALINKIICALKIKRKDDWAMEQLFRLCAFFAIDGNNFARKVIYRQFQKKLFEETPWLGETAIVCMDGYKGVLYLAEYYGKMAEINSDSYVSTSFLYHYSDKKRSDIIKKLKKESLRNSYIKRFLYEYSKEQKSNLSYKPKLDYKTIKSKIRSDKPLFIAPKY